MRWPLALISATALLLLATSPARSVLAQPPPLRDLLPEGNATVVVTHEGDRTLAEDAALFGDPTEAARLLADWGWQATAFRDYDDTQATAPAARHPALHVSLTRFAAPTGATAAFAYRVQDLRRAGVSRNLPLPAVIGDASRQLVSQVAGGLDLTLLVRSGSLLIEITTGLNNSDPAIDPVFAPVPIAEWIIQEATTPPAATPAGILV
jgi:hypothetical protein